MIGQFTSGTFKKANILEDTLFPLHNGKSSKNTLVADYKRISINQKNYSCDVTFINMIN